MKLTEPQIAEVEAELNEATINLQRIIQISEEKL